MRLKIHSDKGPAKVFNDLAAAGEKFEFDFESKLTSNDEIVDLKLCSWEMLSELDDEVED